MTPEPIRRLGLSSAWMSPESAGESSAGSRRWLHSRAYDIGLLTLSPLAGLVIVAVNAASPAAVYLNLALTYLVGIPHYLSSFSFYLGDENLSHYRSRWRPYFLGPLAIVALVLLVHLLRLPAIVQSVMFSWNVYHVSLQSAGILSLYRRLAGGDPAERPWAHGALLSVNSTMAFWNLQAFPPLFNLLQAVHPLLPSFLPWACLAAAVPSLFGLTARLRGRGRRVSAAEATFLASSLLMFHPYLWVKDSELATFAMLIGHFVQYLGIVWLLNRRKYAHASGSWHQRALGRVSGDNRLLLPTLVALGLLFLLADRASAALGLPIAYVVLWNALTLVHFYVDGLVWAFRQPFVRQSVGPYLTPEARYAGA